MLYLTVPVSSVSPLSLSRATLRNWILSRSSPPSASFFISRKWFSFSTNQAGKKFVKSEFFNSRHRSNPLVVFCRSVSMASASKGGEGKSVHDFVVKDARGNDVDLSKYKGKILLIVNVASQCGLTNSNYTELSQLYEKYKGQGLEILAFPCNQFGNQEPGSNEQIVEFACTRFKAEYPIFNKVDVNGDNSAPIYKFLKTQKGGFLGDGIKWNFTKFLVDKDGNVVDRYAPTTSPLSIEKDVKKLLGVS